MPIGLGPFELLIILTIVLVVFGAGKLSSVGGALGKGLRDFRKETHDESEAAPSGAQ